MEWWEAVILGLVQGLTEFLPVSSSAHVRVIGPLLPHGADPGAAFTAIIQIGTELAVLLYFRKDIARIVTEWFRALGGADGTGWRARMGAHRADARMGWFVILGSIPIVVLGLLLKSHIETSLRNLYLTATVLALFAVVLAIADKVGAKRREMHEVRPRDAVALGFAQAMALVPGVSRSGGTISMGLFLGLTRETAARYSFLLAIPAVMGSGLFELVTEFETLTSPGAPGLLNTLIASVVAFGVGYVVIVWFLRLISHRSYMPFVIYRICAAAAIFAMLAAGIILPLQ
ncbi:undecaprenyl-diphosphate phosphatase [Demequina pelophila]|uniref:undecaprenyl-diphosphate phosphatase n=1 Tax=Demequina pelophila TaxID=1638984 RepID=UPI000783F661|nr:undecaprenyl-diphosphate phosphatase [Demequina pelophila]